MNAKVEKGQNKKIVVKATIKAMIFMLNTGIFFKSNKLFYFVYKRPKAQDITYYIK